MPDQPTVRSEEEAAQVLWGHLAAIGAVTDQPARGATLETPAGWAFFNAKGYMGTVTAKGEVITEPGMVEE